MKNILLAGIFFCLAPGFLRAENIVRGPYLQLLTADSVVIRWRTDKPGQSVVWFGTNQPLSKSVRTDIGLAAAADKENKRGSALLNFKRKHDTEHAVRLTGLVPGTKYFYSIEASLGQHPHPQHFFTTAPPIGTAQPLRFWVIGDAGTRTTNQIAVRDAYEKFTADRRTDGWLMLGDNAYNFGTDKEYQGAVFNIYTNTLAQSCLWPTLGNHDARSADSDRQSGVYYKIFSLPSRAEAGGIPSGTEAYYSFDHGNVHFICLDSSDVDRSPTGRMLKWLRDDLRANKQTWSVAYFHHPPYTKGSHDSDKDSLKLNDADSGGRLKEMREYALPILEAGGVDLVLAGHSHSYERSFLLDGHYGLSSTLLSSHKKNSGNGREDGDGAYLKPTAGPAPHEGTVYIVAGSSGKISGGKLNHPAMFISKNELGSLVLDFNTNRLDVTFLGATGNKIDHFTIVKGR